MRLEVLEHSKFIVFRIRSRYFAIPSRKVREILDSHGNIKTVFYGGKALKGLMNFEGEAVSVLNTPFILDVNEEGDDSLILLCKDKEMEKGVGITASEIAGIEVVNTAGIIPPANNDAPYIKGFLYETGEKGERVVTFLDLERFLDYADTRIERL